MRNLENKIIYQIYPKSFKDTSGNGIGDLRGIISKLDYLKNLGIDYLWLSPICLSPQNDNGYDIADYYTIDPLFGTNDDYYELIGEAKKRGIKIMMDLVLNHTSSEHEWFKKALTGDKKYQDYYIFRDKPNDIGSFFGGNAWTYSKEVGKYYFRLFDTTQPDLNWENEEVRQEIYKMVNFWIDKGIEGFRLDVIDLIGKEPDKMITGKGPKFYDYLAELQANTFKDKILTVGECWASSIEETNKMCNDKMLTQAFHFNHLLITNNNDKWFRKKINLHDLVEVLENWQNNYAGIEALVMNNHDLPRLISSWLDDTKYRVESAKLAITLFGLLRGNLYLYQGEEIGMTNGHLFDIADYVDVETVNKYEELKSLNLEEEVIMDVISMTSRDNGRLPMQWDSGCNASFSKSKPWLKVNSNYKEVNVEKDIKLDQSIYAYYQDIIKFRKENYNLIDQKISFEVNADVLKYTKGKITFYASFGSSIALVDKHKSPIFSNYSKHVKKHLRPYEVYFSIEE